MQGGGCSARATKLYYYKIYVIILAMVTSTIDSKKQIFDQNPFTATPGYEHYLNPNTSATERQNRIYEFLNNPDLTEPRQMMDGRHNTETVKETIELYGGLLDELMCTPSENRSQTHEELIDKIIRKTGELFRYEELQLALGSVASSDCLEHRRLAAELSLDIMGGIDKPAFAAMVNELIDLASNSQRKEATELLSLLEKQPIDGGGHEVLGLNDETMKIIHDDLRNIYPEIGSMIDKASKEPVPVDKAVDVCKAVIQVAGLPEEWSVQLDSGKSAHTSIREKTVYYGENRADFPNELAAIGVAFHEAVVHGGRGSGPGGLDFEEGLATCLEQVITGQKRVPGKQYYLSIGLQAGADRGGDPRNYRETFEILWRREVLLMEQNGGVVDIDKARSNAQRQVHRTRRGGAIDTRDSAYFVGAQKAAGWLNDIARLPEEERLEKLRHILSVRYDPTNPDHISYDIQ